VRRAPVASRITESEATYAGTATRTLSVEGGGPPVLLLHGFMDSADTWRLVLEELSRRGRRAVAVDLPGFGKAGPIDRGPMLPALDRFVEAFVAAESDGEPAVLVGNSMGGVAVLRAADARLPSLGAVVAISPAGFGFHPTLTTLERLLTGLVPLLRITYRVPYPKPLVRFWASSFYRLRIARNLVDTQAPKYFGSHFDGMADFRRIGVLGRQLFDELRSGPFTLDDVAVPLLFLWGADDHVCDVSGAKLAVDAMTDTRRLETLPRCGHCPQVERPADVARLIDELRVVES
jgi:pimeloyl-ACP methyl ester carboxylesterase